MSHILVVDDSPVELRLTAGLLEARGFEVVTAANGLEAFESATAYRPDLVVSDLQMPGMNGLELLDALRADHAGVPVVIITSRGTEELAVEALKRGAAGYLPKRRLATELVGVVEQTLEITRKQHVETRWERHVVRRTLVLELPNDSRLLGESVRQIQQLLRDGRFGDERVQLRVGVALQEAFTNAMVHGNLEVSSVLREREDDAFETLVNLRREQSPYRERRVHIAADVSPAAVRVDLRDEGPGFDVSALPDPTDPENLLRCSGRGILMMRSFMDDVVYNAAGNAVTLVKRRSAVPAPTPETRLATVG